MSSSAYPLRLALFGSTTFGLVGLCAAVPARAQAQDAPAAQAASNDPIIYLMQSLKTRGVLSQQDYDAVVARMKPTSPPQTAATSAGTSPTGAADGAASNAQGASTSPDASPIRTGERSERNVLGGIKLKGTLDNGVGLTIGDVNVSLHGSVNGYYVHNTGSDLSPNHTVTGGVAQAGQTSSAIRSGFAPAYVVLGVSTQQRGWDVGMHIGLYPGITSSAGQPNALGTPQALQTGGLDVRQVNLTLSRPNVGEFKIGRDTGLFGVDAELNDIALLGVGIPPANPAPTNSTLGRIGAGYIYSDWIPQITYTTPDLKGLKVSVGVFQPLESIGRSEVNSTPGFQYRATYQTKFSEDFLAFFWSSGIIQKHDPTIGTFGREYTGKGIDFGTKLTYGPLGLVGYYYTGDGLGIIGLFDLGVASNGNLRKGDGYYVQGTYKFGRFQLGGSYGGSTLGLARDEPISELVKHTYTTAGQIRYSLTDWVTLIGEYFHTDSTAHNGNQAKSNTITTGATLAF